MGLWTATSTLHLAGILPFKITRSLLFHFGAAKECASVCYLFVDVLYYPANHEEPCAGVRGRSGFAVHALGYLRSPSRADALDIGFGNGVGDTLCAFANRASFAP